MTEQKPEPLPLVAELRKLVPTILLAVVTSFGASWLTIRDSQTVTQYKLDTLGQQVKANSDAISKQGEVNTQTTIRLGENAYNINNFTDQLKAIKAEQEEIRRSLRH